MKSSRYLVSLMTLAAVTLAACAPQTIEVEVTREVEVEVEVEVPGETIIEEVEVPVEVEVETIVEVEAEFDWRQFEGATVTVLDTDSPGVAVQLAHLDEFEEMTGITVVIDALPWPEAFVKRVLELSGESDTYDVMYVWMFQEKTQYTANQWYEPLGEYIHDPTLTNPDWDWDDFGKMGKTWAADGQGSVYALPTNFGLWGLFARTSLLEKHGLEFPTTIDAWLDAIETCHDPDAGYYGVVARGIQGQNALWHSVLHHARGGAWLDPAGMLATNDDASLQAIQDYARLMQFGPPGIAGFSWNDARQAFGQGQACFFVENYGGSYAYMQDPEVSAISGDVTYGFTPSEDPNRPIVASSQLGWMMNPYSQNKGAAWYLTQWLTSKEAMVRAQAEAGETWPRKSPWEDPAFLESDVYLEEWAAPVRIALDLVPLSLLPPIPNAQEWRDEFGLIMNDAVQNYPNLDLDLIQQRLNEANARFVEEQ